MRAKALRKTYCTASQVANLRSGRTFVSRSFIAEGLERIDGGGAAGREIAGEEGREREDGDC
jgi:hypothetical protein